MTYSANAITDALLYLCRSNGKPVSNLMLQKLLYYAQGWSYALRNETLFHEDMEAWIHGPVVPCVFRRFKHLKWDNITEQTVPAVDQEVLSYLSSVAATYGHYQPKQLERATHSEKPWCATRVGLAPDEASNRVISKALMHEYFCGLVATAARG